MYHVMIVDDQPSSRDFMKYAILLGKDRYTLLESLADADELMNHLRAKTPDLILLDIYTGGKENGIAAAEQVKKHHPHIKIIILTFLIQKRHVERAQQIGCEGFWYKDHMDISLVEVMDHVMAGHVYYPESQPIVAIGAAKSSDFTPKEMQILQAKINGASVEEICTQLHIKRPTLNAHITNMKNKTGYTSFIQLVADVVDKKFIISNEPIG